MSLIDDYLQADEDKRYNYLVLFLAVAVGISLLERAIPHPFPWLKTGAANIFSLIMIVNGRYKDAFLISILRTFLAAMIFGGLFSIGHVFSLVGVLFSTTASLFLYHFFSSKVSIYGVSVVGAYFHSLGQLVVGGVLFFSLATLKYLAPILLLIAIATGFLTGWLAKKIVTGSYNE